MVEKGIRMNMLKEMLREEHERNQNMQAVYRAEIERLPRGSVVIKKSGNKEYCYLQYRDSDKVVSQYVGHADKHNDRLIGQVEERREYERLLRRLRDEEKYLQKALRLKG